MLTTNSPRVSLLVVSTLEPLNRSDARKRDDVAWDNLKVQVTEDPTVGPGVMPWGKHKGVPLDKVPRDYLEWAVRNADKMRPGLRADIERILGLPPSSTVPTPERDGKPFPSAGGNGTAVPQGSSSQDRAVIQELQSRIRNLEGELRSLKADRDRPGDIDKFRRIVKVWFSSLSRVFHPDMGGSPEKQITLNLCYQDLWKRIEETNR